MHGLHALSILAASPVGTTAAALALTGLLTWAGVHKMRQPVHIAVALVRFGIGRRPHLLLGRATGLVEVVTGMALVVPVTRRPGAMVALLLSATFAFLLGRALVHGHEFPCACLGPDDRVSATGLWRAGIMAAAAALIVAAPTGVVDLTGWGQAALLASLVTGGPLLVRARQRVSELQRRIDADLDWSWILQRGGAASATDARPDAR